MISSLNSNNQQFVDSFRRTMDRLNSDQLQIASGVHMRQVSDSPDQVSELLQARAALSTSGQISTNLGSIKAEVDTGEQTLQSAVQLFDQVQTLAAEGATGTATAAARTTLAQQLQSIQQQYVGLANTSIEGRLIFSGDTDQTQPYTAGSVYQGSAATRVALHPNGTTFPVGLTAQQIFDSADPTKNVFGAINGLITALQNNDQAAALTAVDGLGKVALHLNDQLAFYGTTQNKISAASDYASTQQTSLKTEISRIEDADTTSAILDMTQMQTQMQASLASHAQIPRKSLFDFLA